MPWPRPPARWFVSPTRAPAKGFMCRQPRSAQEVLAGPQAHRRHQRHTNAFKINEDVVIPLPRMAEYTDGIERINIELSLRNKIKPCVTNCKRFFSHGNLPLGNSDDCQRDSFGRIAGRPRGAGAGAVDAATCRCALAGLAAADVAIAVSPVAGSHPCAPAGRRRFVPAGRRSSPAQPSTNRSWMNATPCTSGCLRVACGWPCTCMPATAMCIPTSLSTATTTRCCRPRTSAVKRIMVLARSLDGVISGEHGIGITKLEFLSDAELQPFTPTTSVAWTRKAVSTRASCCANRLGQRLAAGHAFGPGAMPTRPASG
jgi:FAD/FMN-containing dehydrogenase